MAERLLAGVREEVAATCRRLAGAGLVVGTAGNLSVRAGELVAVTATGTRFAAMTASDVVVVDLAGALLDGEAEPTSELLLHLSVHADRGDGAIVHTHAPLSTAVACVVDELPVIHYQLLSLGGAVRVAPYFTFGTPELAAAVRAALVGRSGALMSNHGAVTTGRDLAVALEGTLLLEWVCGVYLNASRLGRPRLLDETQQAAVFATAVARGYEALRPVSPALELTE